MALIEEAGPTSKMLHFARFFLCWLPYIALLPTSEASPLKLSDGGISRRSNLSIPLASQATTTFNQTNDYVIYRVKDTPTTLELHHFGSRMPGMKVIRMFAVAVAEIQVVTLTKGDEEMEFGHFIYSQVNRDDRDVIALTVNDFREIHRPLIYSRLLDVAMGIPQYMIEQNMYRELSFEIVVDGSGYVATGYLSYGPWTPPSSTVAVSSRETAVASY